MSDIFEQMIAQHTIAGDNDRKYLEQRLLPAIGRHDCV